MNALPLRIRVEPFAKTLLSSCHILPSEDEEKVCFIVTAAGWVATAVSDSTLLEKSAIARVSCLPAESVPVFAILQSGDQFIWYNGTEACSSPPSKRDFARSVIPTTPKVAQAVVASISRYYGRQVLEPSIRGFLAILEKQFPRNDLYLFELLQNAVDDGANRVSLRQVTHAGKTAIYFCHNGRGFTPLDVLGLSSVGLSSKGDDEKRKIGFMGIGFKAVYKRFAKVTVFDDVWSFQFEQPAATPPIEPSFSWVLKPQWVADMAAYRASQADSFAADMRSLPDWCHFVLERCRGGDGDVLDDLCRLPAVVPVLLGRQGVDPDCLPEEDDGKWVLAWGDKVFTIIRCASSGLGGAVPLVDGLLSRRARDIGVAGSLVGTYFDSYTSIITRCMPHAALISHQGNSLDKDCQIWQFLTVCFNPSSNAKAAFEGHTKRPWKGKNYHTKSFFSLEESGSLACAEEISLFFQINENSEPQVSQRFNPSGYLHAVLPTKLKLPFIMNLQAAWLLSVDRQEVQSLSENAWNHCLISQLPDLIILLLKWIASIKVGPERRLDVCYDLLPPTEEPANESASKNAINVLGQSIIIAPVYDAIKSLNIVPAYDISSAERVVNFLPGRDVIWLPAPMTKWISPSVLYRWFGRRPMATDRLRASAWHSFWLQSLTLPTSDSLMSRHRYFSYSAEDGSCTADIVKLALLTMCALAECAELQRPIQTTSAEAVRHEKTPSTAEIDGPIDTLCGGLVPALSHWPVIPTDGGEAVAVSQLALPDSSEFSTLPLGIMQLLKDGVKFAIQGKGVAITANSSAPSKEKTPRNSAPVTRVFLMHESVEEALRDESKWALSAGDINASDRRTIWLAARRYINIIELSCPDRVVSLKTAAHTLLNNYAINGNKNGFTPSIIQNVVALTNWAMKSDRAEVISHFFSLNKVSPFTENTRYILLPVGQCYVPNFLNIEPLSEASSNGRPFDAVITYVASEVYMSDSCVHSKVDRSYDVFFTKCGVQDAVAMVGQCRAITDTEKVAYLPDKKTLPQLRQSNTSTDIIIPFGFGVFNRKKHIVLDVDLAPEWIKLLGEASRGSMEAAQGIASAFAGLLSAADVASVATASSTPYAAPLLQPNMNTLVHNSLNKRALGRNRNDSSICRDILDSLELQHDALLFPDHRLPQNRDSFPPPLFARLYFLPPGQPGAATLGLGAASWINRLLKERWVPACPPGASSADVPSLVLRPCEVLLAGDYQATSAEMPIARLPKGVLKVLSGLKREISEILAWGSVKPRPPLERFEELIGSISRRCLCRSKVEEGFSVGTIGVSASEYDEVVKLWSLLCIAQRESRLTSRDLQKIRLVCGVNQSNAPSSSSSYPFIFFLPGPNYKLSSDNYVLFSIDMCLDISICSSTAAAPDIDEWNNMAAIALSQTGFLNDLGPRSYENSAFESCASYVNADAWPLHKFNSELKEILFPRASGYKLSVASAEYLRFISELGLRSSCTGAQVYHPDELTKRTYSLATWTLLKEALYDNRGRAATSSTSDGSKAPFHLLFSNEAISRSRDRLLSWVSNYAVFCQKGASPGQSATLKAYKYLACWVRVGCGDKRDVVPVLMDDFRLPVTGCGVSVSSLLNGTQGIQPMGILDHVAHSHRDREFSAQITALEKIDRVAHRALRIPCTSDSNQFSVEVRTSGVAKSLDEASRRLAIVMLILSLLFEDTDKVSTQHSLANCCLLIVKYDSLSVALKCPVAAEINADKLTTSHYALRGPLIAPSDSIKRIMEIMELHDSSVDAKSSYRLKKVRAIYIAGEPEDYAAEMEEFVLSQLFGKHHKIVSNAVVRKTLALLSFIENDHKFNKLFARQFLDFTAVGISDSAAAGSDFGDYPRAQVIKNSIHGIYSSLNPPPKTNAITESLIEEPLSRSVEDITAFPASMPTIPMVGAGRGVSNLPAWMTALDSSITSTITKVIDAEKLELKVAKGRDMPASMISEESTFSPGISPPNFAQPQQPSLEEKRLQVQLDVDKFFDSLPADLNESQSENAAPGSVIEETVQPQLAVGRGRGSYLNKPAWMVSDSRNGSVSMTLDEMVHVNSELTSNKREMSDIEEGEVADSHLIVLKKPKLETNVQLSLSVKDVEVMAFSIKHQVDVTSKAILTLLKEENYSLALTRFKNLSKCEEFLQNGADIAACELRQQKRVGKYGYE